MTREPIPTTGDVQADADLRTLRDTTAAIWDHQETAAALSKTRMRVVLRLRRREPPVLFSAIAAAVGTTEQTIYKIHREARRAEEAGEL